MVRVAVIAAIWLIAGSPILLGALGRRPRGRREDVGEVLARVVAGGAPITPPASHRRATPPVWPLFALSFIATAGLAVGTRPVATTAIVALNLLTVAHGRRFRRDSSARRTL